MNAVFPTSCAEGVVTHLRRLGVVACLALLPAGAASLTFAQAAVPTVTNGAFDTRAASSGLERTVNGFAAAVSPSWVGYVVDGIPGDHRAGDEYGGARCGTVYLEGRRTVESGTVSEKAATASRPVAILLRVGTGAVQKIRTSPADCDLEAGGLAVHWLTGVDPSQSVAFLGRFVKVAEGAPSSQAPSWNSALSAIALHAAPAAGSSLERFAAASQPVTIRKRAAFWLGATRGAEGFAALRRYAEADSDDAFRKELPTALAVSGEAAAVDLLIKMARTDSNSEVRRQAIFWLGQKAGTKVAGTLADAATSDPEAAIKERAVFALSRLPNGEGVDKLIDLARTNRDMAVRKRAIFWLSQSNDPRALDYITTVLKGR